MHRAGDASSAVKRGGGRAASARQDASAVSSSRDFRFCGHLVARERDGGSDDFVCFSLVSIKNSCLLDAEMHDTGDVDVLKYDAWCCRMN